VGEVLRELNEKGIAITEVRISPRQLASLISRVSSGRINLPTAKRVFKRMAETGEDPDAIIVREGLGRIADEGALAEAIARVLDRQPAEVTALVEGKEKLFTFFVGEVMKETGGRADTELVRRLLERALDGRRRR
jgi:aspartyl-tRNA(Asn)/glutamyl-tRNA(Gln) amidotransferase subunit B